jgi:hypothetical protein
LIVENLRNNMGRMAEIHFEGFCPFLTTNSLSQPPVEITPVFGQEAEQICRTGEKKVSAEVLYDGKKADVRCWGCTKQNAGFLKRVTIEGV